MRRLLCILIDHAPVLPEYRTCRCGRCGALITWDGAYGWKYA